MVDFIIRRVELDNKSRKGQHVYVRPNRKGAEGRYYKDKEMGDDFYKAYYLKKGKKSQSAFSKYKRTFERKEFRTGKKDVFKMLNSGEAHEEFDLRQTGTANAKRIYKRLLKQLLKSDYENDKVITDILVNNAHKLKNRFEYHVKVMGVDESGNQIVVGKWIDYDKKTLEQAIQGLRKEIMPHILAKTFISSDYDFGNNSWGKYFGNHTGTKFLNKGNINGAKVMMVIRK